MPDWIHDPWGDYAAAPYATQIQEAERPEFSKLLGPDGNPLRYQRPQIGFDLRPLATANRTKQRPENS